MGKKIIALILTLLILGGATAFFFIRHSMQEKAMTDRDKWETFTHAEFTVTLPKTMKEIDDFTLTDNSMTPVAAYSTKKAGFGVSKIAYSGNYAALKDMNIKNILEKLTFNGSTLMPESTGNGGYYVTYSQKITEKGESATYYFVEALFKGENAMYSATATCRGDHLQELKPYMVQWISSFQPKN